MKIQKHTTTIDWSFNRINHYKFTFVLNSYNDWLNKHPVTASVSTNSPSIHLDSLIYRQIPWYRLSSLAAKQVLDTLPDYSQNDFDRTSEEKLELAVQCYNDATEYNLPLVTYSGYQFGTTPTSARRWLVKASSQGLIPDIYDL